MRQDLELREQAQIEGFTVEDKKTPGVPLVFSKGNHTVWECVYNGRIRWAVATLVNGYYTRHNYHEELRHALDDANDRSDTER